MKQTNSIQPMVVLKLILIILILSLTLPFYGGITTSALDSLDFVQHNGQDIAPPTGADNVNEVKPPAKVNYDNIDAEPTAPVQVIPIPSHPDAGDQATPVTPPAVSPLPGDSETNSGSKPEIDPNREGVQVIGKKPLPVFNSSESGNAEDENMEEAAANTGMLLQNLLDQSYRHEGEKVAYLTFDDGPTPHLTDAIMDILQEENVKATFFPIGSNAEAYPWLIKRAYKEGHGIGNHSYSHVFKRIYSKPQNFVDELIKTEEILQAILGEDKNFRLARFPGGSFGKNLKPFREAVNQAGFGYIDWNSLNGDAESVKSQPAKQLFKRFKQTFKGQSGLIVLMHDAPGKDTTAEALPDIIQFLRSEGYRFELLPGSR